MSNTNNQPEEFEGSQFGEYKHYVYALIDATVVPAEIFYVGKGVNDRIDAHEEEANKSADLDNHPKLERIRSLQKKEQQEGVTGEYFKARIIGRYKSNDEARAVEATLIKFVYGRDNLTNKVHGAHHFMVRARGDWSTIAGIDNVRNVNTYLKDGKYTENQRRLVIENNIVEKLEMLKSEIETSNLGVIVSEPDLSKVQDPTLWIQWLGSDVQISLKLQLTGKRVVTAICPLTKQKDDVQKFKQRLASSNEQRSQAEQEAYAWEPKGQGTAGGVGWYCQTRKFIKNDGTGMQSYPNGFPLEELEIIISEIRKVKALCS
jgi:hypothetical protein